MPYFSHSMATSLRNSAGGGHGTMPATQVKKDENTVDATQRFTLKMSRRKLLFMQSLIAAQVGQIMSGPGPLPLDASANRTLFSAYEIQQDNVLHSGAQVKILGAKRAGSRLQTPMAVRVYPKTENGSLHLKILGHLARKHPHVIMTYDLFNDSQHVYVFQEWATRGSLDEFIEASGGPLGERRAAIWAKQIYRALDFLGDQGIAHRDLSPQHLVVQPVQGDAEAWLKLTGFKQSLIYWDPATLDVITCACWPAERRAAGGANFQAPEVYGGSGQQFDPVLADIWAYGATVYCMLVWQYPYNTTASPSPSAIDREVASNVARSKLSEHCQDFLYFLLRASPQDRMPLDFVEEHPWIRANAKLLPADKGTAGSVACKHDASGKTKKRIQEPPTFTAKESSGGQTAKQPTPTGASTDTASATELGNVLSLPMLTETPSRLENFTLQQRADAEATGSAAAAGETLPPEATDAPMLNHVLSAESLVEGHCGSAALPPAHPRAPPGKRQLIGARYLIDGSVQPIGILLGSVGAFLNVCLEPTNALVRAALVSSGSGRSSVKPSEGPENDLALDVRQVDERDSSLVSKIFQIETKPNLITVTPTDKGRVLFYDQTGRGIQLLPGSQLKLDGDRIALWVGHVGLPSSSLAIAAAAGPTCPLEVLKVERPTRGTMTVKGKGGNSRSHKVEVTNGTATLLLWRTGPSAQAQELSERGLANSPTDLLVVVENLAETGAGIAIDELFLWDERMAQAKAKVEAARLDVAQQKKGDCHAEGNFPALTFASAQLGDLDLALEYLIFGSGRLTAGLVAIGVLTGATVGFLHSPPVTTLGKDVSPTTTTSSSSGENCLHLHLALSDIHNRSLMELRRRLFGLPETERLRVTVGARAVVNLCGDEGGGWIVAPGSVLTLSCARLVQLYRCAKSAANGAAPVRLETATQAVTLEDPGSRRLAINSGEATFLLTDSGKTIAFYIH